MKSLLLFTIFIVTVSFNGMCDVIHVRNTTAETIYAHVYFNDGTDCIADNDMVVCVPPFEGVTIDLPGIPFSVQVNEGCPVPDWTTSSWRHSPFAGCTDAPIFSETPYILTWAIGTGDPDIDWGVVISE